MTDETMNLDEDNEDREWIRTQRKQKTQKDMTLQEAMTILTPKQQPDKEKPKPK